MAIDHRSLLRTLNSALFEGMAEWTLPEHVPDECALEMQNGGGDQHTSLWHDGDQEVRFDDALLGMALEHPLSKPRTIAWLWQDDLPTVGPRVNQVDPPALRYGGARGLHYELAGQTAPADYVEIVLGFAKRNQVRKLSWKQIYLRIERAVLSGGLKWSDLDSESQLCKKAQELFDKRNITAIDARAVLTSRPFYDLRNDRSGGEIEGAIPFEQWRVREHKVIAKLKKEAPAVVFCEDGVASRELVTELDKYPHAAVMIGGFAAWKAAIG